METDRLIELLARGAGPAPRHLPARRLGLAVLFGLAASATLALGLIGPIPSGMWATPAPWLKLAYAAGLAATASWWAARLARPAAPVAGPARAAAGVLAAVALLGLLSAWATPASERLAALLGHSWSTCPWNVFALSLPALAAVLWALRGLAPTQPMRAGFAAGLAAGAVGALGYSMACDEAAPAFVAAWYTLGVMMVATLGAALGPRVLRW